jgi:hypothetical protein
VNAESPPARGEIGGGELFSERTHASIIGGGLPIYVETRIPPFEHREGWGTRHRIGAGERRRFELRLM